MQQIAIGGLQQVYSPAKQTYVKNPIKISKRELEILTLISLDHSEKAISKILHISHHTVHAHKRNLLRKFGASTAAGLVRKGFEHNYLGQQTEKIRTPEHSTK